MGTQQHHHEKVRVVIECSEDERAYIKMLAARKHMTISEYFLSKAKDEMNEKPKKRDALKAASGIWANRKDLPDFDLLRTEFDRLR